MEYVLPIVFFLLISLVAGVLLTVAGKLLYVKTDETVEKIISALPGANCSGCGYSGCEGYANAVAKGEAAPNLCRPGGIEVNKKISEALGVAVVEVEPEVAFVRCGGGCGATSDKYTYVGTPSCTAAEKFYNGKGSCAYGCSGFGDCAVVCESDAISIQDGIAVINPSKCIACGKCIKACPNNLIIMRKISQTVNVRCFSSDTGKATRSICKNGCIACKICEKKCPNDAIHVVNNHAEIDPEKCTSCGICAEVCPSKCIVIQKECAKR